MIFLTSALQWSLIACGGEHVVFVPTTRNSEFFSQMVLKVRINSQIKSTRLSLTRLEVEYAVTVGRTFGLPQYLDPMIVVDVSQELWENLSNQLKEHTNDKLSLSGHLERRGIMMENYRKAPVWFELKPKWSGDVASSDIKRCVCKYCSHPKRSYDGSLYCPGDLFSADLQRIENAIKAYFMHDEHSFGRMHVLAKILHQDPILALLQKSHQASIENHSIENPIFLTEEEYLEHLNSHVCVENSVITNPLLLFLASFSIRDCSLFVQIYPEDCNIGKSSSMIIDSQRLYYEIRIIDVDIKSICRLPKYRTEIDRFYSQR